MTNFLDTLEKYSNIKLNENPSTGSQVVPCRQTVRHYVISCFSHFLKRAYMFTLLTLYLGVLYLFQNKWQLLSYITQTNGLS